MFTDWTQALEAEGLPIDPTTTEQEAAAARVTARNAGSKEDLVLLLDVLGLPGDGDTLTTLLPLLTGSEGDPDMPQTQTSQTPNAFEATALSMYYADSTTAEITEATGLTEDEITALVSSQEEKTEAMLDAEEQGVATIEPAATDAESGDLVEQLLAWAEAHPAADIRNKAAQVRGDLAELTALHATDDARRKAEERVAALKAELDKAQEELRALEASILPTVTAAAVPTPIRSGMGSGRSPKELAAVRSWARANGHRVADKGMVAKKILDAYDAAHQAPAAKAS